MTLDTRPSVDGTPLQQACWACADLLLAKAGKASPPKEDIAKVWTSFAIHTHRPSTRHTAYGPRDAPKAAEDAIKTMLSIAEGDRLVREMAKLRRKRIRVRVHFMDLADFPTDELGGEHRDAHFFKPSHADAAAGYDIYIAWTPDARPGDILGAKQYRLGVSEMAEGVFHELLHVWFIHKFADDGLGHSGGLNDSAFARRVRDFQDELLPLDKTRARGRPR